MRMRPTPLRVVWLTVLAVMGLWSTRASAVPLVERRAIVPAGEGLLSMGAGTWLREGTNVTVGHLDLRVGVLPRLEVRILLPGIAFEAVVERDGGIPAVVLFLGLCEAGFNTIAGATLAYQVGVRVSKRVLSRLRLGATGELRHRLLGSETAELAVVGPLPANRALVGGGELTLQLFEALAFTGQLGYAQTLGEGRSFGFGGAGLLATVRGRLDIYASAFLERSRADRTFAPAVFGGIAMRF